VRTAALTLSGSGLVLAGVFNLADRLNELASVLGLLLLLLETYFRWRESRPS